jgi:hypothetical protein
MNGRNNMSRYVVLVAALTVMLLVGWGCEQEQTGVAPPLTPPTIAEPQPAETKIAVEPKPAEAEQKPVETKQPAQPEPNAEKVAPTEPNVQQIAATKPAPAESNSPELRPAPPAQTPAAQLCSRCTDFLSKHVDQQGMMDYKTLLRRKLELVNVLDEFKSLNHNEYNSWSKDDKLAFWINAYNLELMRAILDNYPIESNRVLRLFWPPNSIRHIKGLWDQHKFIIMNEEFTLQEITRRFFKKEFDDPRVFFAIYYGSLSGPPLRNEAYCGQNLSAQLDDQIKRFIAAGGTLKIERENQRVYLSSMLSSTWNGQQFVAKYGTDLKFKQQEPEVRAVLNLLTKYISPQDVGFLETGNYTVDFMVYDWTLNDRGGQ